MAMFGNVPVAVPVGLHPDTIDLVRRFAAALAARLRKAEGKYGYTNGWKTDPWEAECRRQLNLHVAKGDPLDVAAFCAFMWARGWNIAAMAATPINERAALGQHLFRQLDNVCVGIDVAIVADALTALMAMSIRQRAGGHGLEATLAIADATGKDITRSLQANWNEETRTWR